ncbi:MAG: CapK related-protein [Candidatus Brocadiaceae bacterium]|nr:CapK related-protein [Candidatus Brocadiaceae bacterium]
MKTNIPDYTIENEDFRNDIISRICKRCSSIEVLRYFFMIKKTLRMSHEELRNYQNRKLKNIIQHAYLTTPYYKNLLDNLHLKPADFRSVSDLNKIPITSKHTLKNLSFSEILSSFYPKEDLVELKTGGSTGTPMKIYISKKVCNKRVTEGYRIFFLHGFNIFDKVAIAMFYDVSKSWYNALGVLRNIQIDYKIPLKEQVEVIINNQPEIIEGYPSRLHLISKCIKKNNIHIMKKPKAIFTNSETLLPNSRKEIEEVFGIKITNVYDCWEFGRIAWECKMHDGLHINSDSLIVQIVNENGREAKDGEPGNVIVTDLNNYAMPFIRYKMDDIAIRSEKKCLCGISFPLLREVRGRESDNLKLPSGGEIIPFAVGDLVLTINEIEEYQIVQNTIDSIDINIVCSNKYDFHNDNILRNKFKNITEFKQININHVNEIKRTKSNKLRTVICNVK